MKLKPEYLDVIKVSYKGVSVNVFGVLHALSGGLNQEYVIAVNKTIQKEKDKGFVILSEKSMKKMYNSIDIEVEDWLQMSFKESFYIGIKILWLPNLFNIAYWFIKEKISKKDMFSLENPDIKYLGGSMAFHALSPLERRELAGFPTPIDYLKKNIQRKKTPLKYPGVKFPAQGWSWLTKIEPFVNIPLRSIHMIEYACEYAIRNNLKDISLFVGEIHNSDIQWYTNDFKELDFNDNELNEINKAKIKALIPFNGGRLLKEKLKYFVFTLSGATIMIWIYMAIIIAFFK